MTTTHTATHTEVAEGGSRRWYSPDLLLCVNCRDWRDVLAHPGPAPGSMRVCAQGKETHAGTWKRCWTKRTPDQLAEDAHALGRLF